MTPLDTCIFLAGYLEALPAGLTEAQVGVVRKLLDDALSRPRPFVPPDLATAEPRPPILMRAEPRLDTPRP